MILPINLDPHIAAVIRDGARSCGMDTMDYVTEILIAYSEEMENAHIATAEASRLLKEVTGPVDRREIDIS